MIRTCVITQFLFILLLNLGALNVHKGLVLGCYEAEREALLQFKHSLTDLSNRLSSWNGKGCCDWEGVGCDNVTAFVNRLDLPNHFYSTYYNDKSSFLTAPKIDPSLLELRHLDYLDLSGNDFQGSQIPKFIGSFKYLRYLNLSYSNFSGIVPSQLGNLTRLRTLDLFSLGSNSVYQLSYASIDLQWVSRLVSLQYLDFGGNDIFHTNNSRQALNMPPSLIALHLRDCQNLDNALLDIIFSNSTWRSRIQYLDLSDNTLGFSGRVVAPHVLANMTSLTYLDLSANQLDGSISLWLGNMTSLTYLGLAYNELNGSIPLWLGNMTSLTHLDLSQNQLDGSIPLWLGNLTSLTHLDLSQNKLDGSIPLSMNNMRKLEYLLLSDNSFSRVEGDAIMGILRNLCKLINFDLSSNSIGGSIEGSHKNFSKCISYDLENLNLGGNMIGGTLPSWIGDFKYLRVLDISQNRINGPIPVSIGRLSHLEQLDLSNNTLNGTLPQGLGQCKALVSIDLSLNFLNGALSEFHLDNLSGLHFLDLSYNAMEWNISSNWSPPFQLSTLRMTSCKIQSQFPRWIAEQTMLAELDFSDNNIFGELPQFFSSNWLFFIVISHNQITGRVPYFTSSVLSDVDLSFNLLSGPLVYHNPSDKNDTIGTPVCQVSNLWKLDLHMNNISGIHDCWGGSGDQSYIDLSSNNISGTIPDCWAGLRNLAYINLASNNFSGIIPLSMGLNGILEFLKLSNNSLQGRIPPTLCTSSTLQILDLGDNKLVGNIPSNWGRKTLSNLVLLRLRGNKLVGSIPPTLCDIHTLQFIDLSLNNLTGSIPHCFGHLHQMKSSNVTALLGVNDESIMVVLKGAELEYTTTLEYVVNLDLSCNALTGVIPEEITNLSALIGLNLSHNHLTGNIPNKIGEMTSLESLDLSNNNLSGKIPPSISALTSLVRLNLSYNKLQGEIPSGHQLQVIEDPSMTYIGNPGLCGDPLPNKCRSNHGENQPIQGQEKPHKEVKKDNWEKPVLYLVIMSGFATGFWGVVGSLVLKTRFRFAFFQVVGNVADYLYVQVMIRLNRHRNEQ